MAKEITDEQKIHIIKQLHKDSGLHHPWLRRELKLEAEEEVERIKQEEEERKNEEKE